MAERAETLTTALYSALDPSEREIRLLHRSKDNDNNYRLSVFSFDNAPPFFALSYVWGSSDDQRHVVVEGVSMPVTTNLAAALAQVWSATDCEYLWADALCINQSDTPEKNHQVPLMRQIYGRSSRVLMWLGDASADSDLALDFLREWAGAFCEAVAELHRNGKAAHLHARFLLDDSDSWMTDPEERVKASAAVKMVFARFPAPFAARAFDDESWGAVDALFERSYWTRIWILQEVVLANAATVMCGVKTLDLADLMHVVPMFHVMIFCNVFASPDEPALPLGPNHIGCLNLDVVRTMRTSHRNNSEYTPLICLAHDTTDFEATDVRDRVFALLGLLPEGATSVVPNYSRKPLPQIARDPSFILATGLPWLHAIFRSLTIIRKRSADPRAMGNPAVGFLLMVGMAMDTGDHAWACTNDVGESATAHKEAIWARVRALVGEMRTSHPHLRPPIALLARYLGMNGTGTDATENILAKFCGGVAGHPTASSFVGVLCQDFGDAEYVALFQDMEEVLFDIKGGSLAMTKGEFMGFAQPGVEVGDVICIIFGCDVPIVARRVEQDRLLMIGQGRFYGMMDGELMDKLEEGAFEEQDLVFV